MEGDTELGKLNPFRYRSYYFDEEIGMYYLQSRYYDAEIGRFINADDVNLIPTMQTGIKGTNLFEYCEGNPVNKEDPSGFYPMTLSGLKQWVKDQGLGGLIFGFVSGWLSGKFLDKVQKTITNVVVNTIAPRVKSFMARFSRRIAKMAKSVFKRIVKNALKACRYLFNALKYAWRFHRRAVVVTSIVALVAGVFIYVYIRYRK